MRSAAPGPAPMKWTVMGWSPSREGAGDGGLRRCAPGQGVHRAPRLRAPRLPRPSRRHAPRRRALATACCTRGAAARGRIGRQASPRHVEAARGVLEARVGSRALRWSPAGQRIARNAARGQAPAPRAPRSRRRRRCAGNPPRPRSWLRHHPLRDGHRRPPAVHAADRLETRERQASHACRHAARRARRAMLSVSSVTALMTSRPPASARPRQHRTRRLPSRRRR